MMPNKIVQYWSDSDIPPEISCLMESWKEHNKDFQHEVYDFYAAKKFIRENYGKEVADIFCGLQFPSMQADVFRVAYLNIFGGVYVDAASRCRGPVSELIAENQVVLVRKWHGRVCNGFISSPAGSEYISRLWKDILLNIQSFKDGDVWGLTGPKLFIDNYDEEFCFAVDQKIAENVFSFVNDLNYKALHWSKLQKILPLHKVDYSKKIVDYCSDSLVADLRSKSLVVHLGQHKTGSTAIQRELVGKDDISGFLYPKVGRLYSGHHGLAASLGKKETKWLPVVMELVEEIVGSGEDKVVLSSEFFSSLNELEYNKIINSQVLGVLGGLASLFGESSVIYYVRDQVSAFDSRINQAIKSRVCLSEVNVADVINRNPTLDYSVFNHAIERFFSASRVVPVVYDRKWMRAGDVRVDFMERSGLKFEVSKGNYNSNEKIRSPFALASCFCINRANIPLDEKMKLKSFFISAFDEGGEGYTMTREESMEVYNAYVKSNEYFFKSVLHSSGGGWEAPLGNKESFMKLVNDEVVVSRLIEKLMA